MEASVEAPRRLEGEKAQRIIEAMRASVGTRGAAASTFDHVAREAGVSRGLLLLLRLQGAAARGGGPPDCEVRIKVMDERLARADSVDALLQALVVGLEEFIEEAPGSQAVTYEMLSASRHSDEIRAELAELYRRWRSHLADALREGAGRGGPAPGRPESVAAVLFALGDGFGIQLSSDPEWDSGAAFELGVGTARRLLGA